MARGARTDEWGNDIQDDEYGAWDDVPGYQTDPAAGMPHPDDAPAPGGTPGGETPPPPPPSPTPSPTPPPTAPPPPIPPPIPPTTPTTPFPPVNRGGDDDARQRRLADQLAGRIDRGYQPDSQYGAEVMRLMRLQEERAAQDAQRRSAFEDQLRSTLMDLIRRGQEPVSPEATPESKAFARVRERALGRYRAQQAEQRAAQGIGQNPQGEVSGALASDIQGGEAQLAEQIAAFESKMIADQINRRRAELMQALQLGAGMLTNEQSNAIRRELAQLDTALKREMGHADLGLREFLGGGQLSLGLLGALQQNSQFYDRLGYDVGLSEAMLNQNGLNPLFGGYQLR